MKAMVNLKEIGADLGSMQDLIEMHSHCFVLQAIKYGLIPYVPSIRKLGQEWEWPESHELVTDPKYWKVGWRDDPTYNGLHDSADTVHEIAEWTCDRERYPSFAHTRGTYRCLACSASTNKVVMAAIAGTAATANEGSVHKDAVNSVYDMEITRGREQIQRTVDVWSKAKVCFDSDIRRAVNHYGKAMGNKVTEKSQDLICVCNDMCKILEEVSADDHVNGKFYYSKAVLEECLVMCREISKDIRDIDTWIDILGLSRSNRHLIDLSLQLR